MSRPNKCIKDETGNEYWISRSVVVISVVFKYDIQNDDIYVLVERRGPAVSHSGEWCCPCGYIDWDESLTEACVREVREETGLVLDEERINLFEVYSDKYTKNQTVDLWYECWIPEESDFHMDKIETKTEVLDVRWLKVAHMGNNDSGKNILTIYKKSIYDGCGIWAFKSHHTHVIDMLKSRFSMCDIKEVDE